MTPAQRWYRAAVGVLCIFLIAFAGTLIGVGLAMTLPSLLSKRIHVAGVLLLSHLALIVLYVRYEHAVSVKLSIVMEWAFGDDHGQF